MTELPVPPPSVSPENAREFARLYLGLAEQLEAASDHAQAALERRRARFWTACSDSLTQIAKGEAMPKLCTECRWIKPVDYDVQASRCGHAAAARVAKSLVDGSDRPSQIACYLFRAMHDGCGEEGKFWEARDAGFV